MNCSLPKITYPIFRQLLLAKIHKTVDLCTIDAVAKDAACTEMIGDSDEISMILNVKDTLKRVRKSTSVVVYRSAIALKLAAVRQLNVANTALRITEILQSLVADSLEKERGAAPQLLRDLTVSALESGLVEFVLGDRAIAAWLQAMVDHLETQPRCKRELPFRLNAADRGSIFLCQQTYARCSSLLRTAGELTVPLEKTAIPWLMNEEKLRFPHPSDRALVSELVSVTDELSQEETIVPLKVAVSLSQQFQNFYRDCRIFGEIASQDRHLAQARLGLVMITHSLLRTVLEENLGVVAPDSL